MITSTQDIKNFFYEFEWKKVFNIGVNMFCEVDRQDKTSIVLNDLTDIGAIIDYYEGDYNRDEWLVLLQAKNGAYAYFAVKIEEYEDSLDYYATSFISSSLEKLVKLGISQDNLAKLNHNDINLLIEKERLEQSVAVKENSNIKMKI